jgi:hypothetical protein
MLLLLTVIACESSPVQVVTRPTDIRLERFCRDETPTKDELDITKPYIKEVLLKDGWTYEGPLHNDGINCTVTLWTR